MRILHEIAGLAAAALLASVAVSVLGPSLSAQGWGVFCEPGQWNRLAVATAAAGCLALVLVYLLTGMWAIWHPRYHTFRKDGGRISISRRAINSQVLNLEAEFPPVVKMRSRVRSCRKAIDVAVDVRVVEGTGIEELAEALQNRIRHHLAESLGLSDVRRVDVRVRHIHSHLKP